MSDHRGNPIVRTAVRLALAGNALAAFGVAHGQAAPAPTPAPPVTEEVVVTGSRIVVPNEVAISPVIAITPATIQESGALRIEDLLNALPQVYAAQNAGVSNGADGTAQVDLRGLAPKRTLVLVNGRRLGPGTPVRGGGPADLNQIPAELIERIDVLTGGASSVYGADAVAGVVNFILNDHFSGVKFTADYGLYSHHNDNPQGVATDLAAWNANNGTRFTPAPSNANDGYQRDLAFLMGFNAPENNGNVTLYGTYRRVAPALQNLFDYSACSLGSGFTNTSVSSSGVAAGHFSCGPWPVPPRQSVRPEPRRKPGVAFCRWRRDAGAIRQFRPLQLRTVELLPASGRALYRRRLCALHLQRPCRAVLGGSVRQRSHHRADRRLGRVLRHRPLPGELRQSRALSEHDQYLVRWCGRSQHERFPARRPAQRRRRTACGRSRAPGLATRGRGQGQDQRCLELRRLRSRSWPRLTTTTCRSRASRTR